MASASSTAAMCLSRQLVAPLILQVKDYLPEKKRRVQIVYRHKTLSVEFVFIFLWEKQRFVLYDNLEDSRSTEDKGRVVFENKPTLEVCWLFEINEGGGRECPRTLDVSKDDMVEIDVDHIVGGVFRQHGHPHKSCGRIRLDLSTAWYTDFIMDLSEIPGLPESWCEEYVYLINDLFYIDEKTLKVDYRAPMCDGWVVNIRHLGY